MSDKIASERLYLTADRDRVVHEGHPDARFLMAGEGDEIPAEYLDLVPKKKAATKRAAKPADKSAKRGADKSATPDDEGEPVEVELEADEPSAPDDDK